MISSLHTLYYSWGWCLSQIGRDENEINNTGFGVNRYRCVYTPVLNLAVRRTSPSTIPVPVQLYRYRCYNDLQPSHTIINAKDSLFPIGKKFRSIVEFAGEGLGYTSVYVPVLAYFGGRIAVVWRKSHEVAMPSAHPDIFTVWAVLEYKSRTQSVPLARHCGNSLWRSLNLLAIEAIFLILNI